MINRLEVYKCTICKNIVQTLQSSTGDLACCEEPMIQIVENIVDAAEEKHIPIIEKNASGFKVKIGSIPHPMDDNHYIQWIELLTNNESLFKFINPGEAPEAVFNMDHYKEEIYARAHCNLHGLWKGNE